MASKKKLSLQEFMQDQSFGWADDDFDPSSISVPLMNQRPHHDAFVHHQPHFTNVQPRPNREFHGYNGPHSGPSGPPYIVKISNIPAYFGNEHIEELFGSRFMQFVKLKLFWEVDLEALRLSPNPADALNKRKKVAFVEVSSPGEFDKVLKWTDVYIDNGMGKLRLDPADFDDFKMHVELNQNVQESNDPSMSVSRRRLSNPRIQPPIMLRRPQAPVNNDNYHQFPSHQAYPPIPRQPIHDHILPPLHPASPAPPPRKSNPFGDARPVDTLSKQLELEKKLKSLEINSTTFRTIGHAPDSADHEAKRDVSKPKPSQIHVPTPVSKPQPKPSQNQTPTPVQPATPTAKAKQELRPASEPSISAWGNKTSTSTPTYSEIASPPKSHPLDLHIENGSSSASFSKKKSSGNDESGKKMVVLKRKHIEPKKSRVTSPEVKDTTLEHLATTLNGTTIEDPKKNLTNKSSATNTNNKKEKADTESETSSIKESIKKTQLKKERVKKEKPGKGKPNKEDKKDAPSFERSVPHVIAYSQEQQTDNLTKEKKKPAKVKKVKNSKERAEGSDPSKSSSTTAENTPEVIVPTSTSTKPQKNTKVPTTNETKPDAIPDVSPEEPRPKSKRFADRRGRGRGRGGSSGPTRDSSISPANPTEKPPQPSTDKNSTETKEDKGTPTPSISERGGYRGRGAPRGRGVIRRGRGGRGAIFGNLSQTYNNKSETKPSE